MARVLIVGCGCRGRALAAALVADGYAVRGTTRRAAGAAQIEAGGAQAAVADPDRLATLLPQLEGVGAICWLMGSARGEPERVAELHGPRLRSLLEHLVDTPVRGFVYEAAGAVEAARLDEGAALVRDAGKRWQLPVALVDRHPREHEAWVQAMRLAVGRLLAAG